MTDALGVIPGLGDYARRLKQHASNPERRIDLDQEVRLDPESSEPKPFAP